jgi:molybdenum cofactor biosynthesis protein MoaC
MTFSHLDSEGAARMVDVGEKAVVRRTAVAGGFVRMSPETIELLQKAALPKGDALNTARIAGVMAAKKTPELIPLCHGLNPLVSSSRSDAIAFPSRPQFVRATVLAWRWRPSPRLAWPR